MTYIALYRKYRSQSFDELLGQEHVTVTLQNSIRSGRIAHAYLFYGARGCGKTSTARLLARALNCVAQEGPTPEPCGECRLCTAIRDGICMDVMEMDAASETGIDDVREKIVENVQYAPGEARYKVYIIDEAHDLSAKAFDALLKTLEEPPAHVIFILATTEHHKVPITIRSRCMEYHFKRGTLQDLARAVQRVVDQEGYAADADAIHAIARSAEGSWRDALSLLEQALAYADGRLTVDAVHRAIGTVGSDILGRVVHTIAAGDWQAALEAAGELVESGKDVRQLFAALSAHLRDLMLIAAGATNTARAELGAERYEELEAQASRFTPSQLLAMSSVVAVAEREIRFTNQHRWLLESALLRMMPENLMANTVPAAARAASAATAAPGTGTRPPPAATSPHATIEPSRPPTATPARSAQNREPTRFAREISFEVIGRAWKSILDRFKRASPQGYPWLERAEVAALEGHTILLSFGDEFARQRIQNNAKGKAMVEQIVNEVLGSQGYSIRCIPRGSEPVAQQAEPPPEIPLMPGLLNDAETETGGGVRRLSETGPQPEGGESEAGGDSDAAPMPRDTTPEPDRAGRPAGSDEIPDDRLLADALSVFGGSVIRTEPLNPQ